MGIWKKALIEVNFVNLPTFRVFIFPISKLLTSQQDLKCIGVVPNRKNYYPTVLPIGNYATSISPLSRNPILYSYCTK